MLTKMFYNNKSKNDLKLKNDFGRSSEAVTKFEKKNNSITKNRFSVKKTKAESEITRDNSTANNSPTSNSSPTANSSPTSNSSPTDCISDSCTSLERPSFFKSVKSAGNFSFFKFSHIKSETTPISVSKKEAKVGFAEAEKFSTLCSEKDLADYFVRPSTTSRSLALLFNVEDDDNFAEMIVLSSRKERQSEFIMPASSRKTFSASASCSNHKLPALNDWRTDNGMNVPETSIEQKALQKAEFRRLLLRVYQRCNCDKLENVDSFMTIYFDGYEEKLFTKIKSKYQLTESELQAFDNYMDTYQPVQKSIMTPRDAQLIEELSSKVPMQEQPLSKLRQTAPPRIVSNISNSTDNMLGRMSESLLMRTKMPSSKDEISSKGSGRSRSHSASDMNSSKLQVGGDVPSHETLVDKTNCVIC